MGQGASSTRCPNPGESQSSQTLPSLVRRGQSRIMSSSLNQGPPDSRNIQTRSSPVVQSRRRSFSPDPENTDSRRSARIRRRLSRFVSSNASLNYSPGRDSNQDSVEHHESTENNISSATDLPRRQRIGSRLLHRQRSPTRRGLDAARRERPFSMLAPRLGALPFSLPRSTGSFDLPPSHRMADVTSNDADIQQDSAFPTPRIRIPGSAELRPSSGFLNDRISRRNSSHLSGDSLRHNFAGGSNSTLSQPPPSQLDSGSVNTPSSTYPDHLPNDRLLGSRNRHNGHRALREARENLSMGSSRLSRSGEDQATLLSRLLSFAAAQTAASLVGSNTQALSEARDASGGSVDGSFESFLHALQNGRLASALRNSGGSGGSGGSSDADISEDLNSGGSVGPPNFFRMFRFGATSSTAGGPSNGTENTRMVPVIIVGIRSVNPRDGNLRDGRPSAPFLEALSGAPTLSDLETIPNSNNTANSGSSSPFRSTSRAEYGVGRGPASPLTTSSEPNGSLDRSNRSGSSSNEEPIETPEGGEIPSPRTSAPDGLFGTTFANSSRSTSDVTDQSSGSFSNEAFQPNRRRSSSPDSARGPSEGTRSWIIYVLGGSYPENHPILTTPSLFTDAPTYEDMMLLSSLIAPVKPPIASQEDVESAGGLFTVSLGEALTNDDGSGIIRINAGERCLVCLCDFENGEVCRQLVRCQHIFHRDCIDEWLTTGRNSCPLCRGKGVEETSRQPDEDPLDNDAVAGA